MDTIITEGWGVAVQEFVQDITLREVLEVLAMQQNLESGGVLVWTSHWGDGGRIFIGDMMFWYIELKRFL